jgi:hypothetical protein
MQAVILSCKYIVLSFFKINQLIVLYLDNLVHLLHVTVRFSRIFVSYKIMSLSIIKGLYHNTWKRNCHVKST